MYGQIHTKMNKYVNYKIKKLVFPFKILDLRLIPTRKRFENCACFYCLSCQIIYTRAVRLFAASNRLFNIYLWVSFNSNDPTHSHWGMVMLSYISAKNLMSPVWYNSKFIYKKANPTDIKSITFKLPLKILRHHHHQHWPWCSKLRPPCKFRRKTTLLHPSSFAALEEHVVKYPGFNDEIKQSKEKNLNRMKCFFCPINEVQILDFLPFQPGTVNIWFGFPSVFLWPVVACH